MARYRRFSAVLCMVFCAVFSFSWAQTNEETFQAFQFSFSTPGARAAGMGRTFVGIANDATAAVTNPAGLTLLSRPQLYVEYKHTDLRTRRLALPDSLSTGEESSFYSGVDALSFFNVAVPAFDGRLVFAFTGHEFLNFEETFVLGERLCVSPECFSLLPVNGQRDFRGMSWGGSVAAQLHETFSIGVTVSVDQLDGKANMEITDPFDPTFLLRNTLDDDDTSVGVTVGALFRPLEGAISLGGVYSRGGDFDLKETFTSDFGTVGPVGFGFKVPDRFGFGLSGRPHDRILLGVDVIRIQYSQLVDEDFLIFENEVLTALGADPVADLTFEDFDIEDGTEVHLGAEVNVGSSRVPVFLRYGTFRNPDHTLRFTGSSSDSFIEAVQKEIFNSPQAEDEWGQSFGLGIIIGQHFQADAAYLSIDTFDEFVLSVAVRF